jgi:hypothetical protein
MSRPSKQGVAHSRAGRSGQGWARACVAIGAVVLLVGNLIPHSKAKGVVLVIGEVLIIVGIVAWAITALLDSRRAPAKRTLDGRPRR